MAFFSRLRRLIGMLFPKHTLEKKLNVQIATSSIMDNAIELWTEMYQNVPPWLGGKGQVKSLNLSASIAEEVSRLVLTEFQFEASGSPRADYITEQLNNFLDNLPGTMELWAAMGGVAIKPYVTQADDGSGLDKIVVDVVQASRFYPTAFNSNKDITGAIFVDSKRIGDYLYTRIEYHNLVGTDYTVINKAFKSEKLNTFTTDDDQTTAEHPFLEEITLASVEEWKTLEPEVHIANIDHPLFIYVKVPRANNVDPYSPLGASVYSRAEQIIEEADRQYSRILWEYEATEAAIDADASLFDVDKKGNPILPSGRERLYRAYAFGDSEKGAGFFKEFAPAIRDSSLFNGLNQLMRKIEFQCGLAYGTLSDPEDVAKTATEIKASKQRSYTTIAAMQKSWTAALEDILHVMDIYCTLYNLVPAGPVDMSCTWGDGVLEDTDAEYQRRWNMVLAGKYKIEKFYSWYFGIPEEEAMELVPDQYEYPPVE